MLNGERAAGWPWGAVLGVGSEHECHLRQPKNLFFSRVFLAFARADGVIILGVTARVVLAIPECFGAA